LTVVASPGLIASCIEVRSGDVDSSATSNMNSDTVVKVPPLALIGWIPLLPTPFDPFPKGFEEYASGILPPRKAWNFLQIPAQRSLALRCLFWSGNHEPPDDFKDLKDFKAYIAAQDFRLALAVYSIQVNWVADVPTLDPGTGFIYEAGFTPVRFPIGSNYLSQLASASGWRETKRVEILRADKNELVFRFRLYVKICRGLDYLQLPLTYRRAPWAAGEIFCKVRRTGDYTVHWSGTRIPTLWPYIDWKRVNLQHDMLSLTGRRVRGFIETGGCRKATLRELPNSPFP
jgi:hypothetical protein